MKPGTEICHIRLQDGEWLEATLILESANQKSLCVSVDEGIPVPFGILNGKQTILLLKGEDGVYRDLQGDRVVEIKREK